MSNLLKLFLFVLLSLITKWIVLSYYFDNDIITNTIMSIKDIQYFPLIINISNLDFSPSYLDDIKNSNIISFPIYGIILHSIFYKFFGIYSFIILEFLFQFIFFFVFYLTINSIFKDSNKTLFFCVLILISTLILKFLYNNFGIDYLKFLYDSFNDNFGTRVPRPLITGIFYFLFYLSIFRLKDNIKAKLNFKYFFPIIFLLSTFINSYFYYFINFSILFVFLFFLYSKNKTLKIFLNNKKLFFILFIFFIIFISPFILQLYFGENDYTNRIGIISINFDQKIFLLKYYLSNLFRIEALILILSCIFTHLYLNYAYKLNYDKIEKINIFFFFVIVSIFSPIVFF